MPPSTDPTPELLALQRLLARAIKRLGLRGAARLAGMDHKNLAGLAAGQVDPRLSTLAKLRPLGITLADLAAEVDNDPVPDQP